MVSQIIDLGPVSVIEYLSNIFLPKDNFYFDKDCLVLD